MVEEKTQPSSETTLSDELVITDAKEIKVFVKYIDEFNSKIKYLHESATYLVDAGKFFINRSVLLGIQYVTGEITLPTKLTDEQISKIRFFVSDGVELARFIKSNKKNFTKLTFGKYRIAIEHAGTVTEYKWSPEMERAIHLMGEKIQHHVDNSTLVVQSVDCSKEDLFDKLITSTLKEVAVHSDGSVHIKATSGEAILPEEKCRVFLCTNQLFRSNVDGVFDIRVSNYNHNKDLNIIRIGYKDSSFKSETYFAALNV